MDAGMKFSEARRLTIDKSWIEEGKLGLKELGKDFFEYNGKPQSSIDIQVESSKDKSFTHNMQRWTISSQPILKEFYKLCKIKGGEEVLLRRVSPTEYRLSPLWKSFKFIDLFAGIGGIRLGFEAAGGKCVFTSEWDEEAQITYAANFGDKPHGDITKITTSDIPHHDILVGGFPCQPFSIIGNREGFSDTRGTLFFEIERIVQDHEPSAILLENVKQFKTHDGGRTCGTVLKSLRKLGYNTYITILNALDYGVAQKRERTFIVAFRNNIAFSFPEPYNWQPDLADIFEPEANIHPKLIASEHIQKKRLERIRQQGREPFYPSMWHENKGGHIGMHPFSCALRHNASYNYLLVNGRRRPTGREMLRLQGFPDTYQIPVDHTSIRAQAGNAVAVPVITAIAARMCLAMRLALPIANYKAKDNQGMLFDCVA